MLECPQCRKELRCHKRGRHARAVWLSMVHGWPEPSCHEFEEIQFLPRGYEWQRNKQRSMG